jgi:hypothetical protein
MNIDAFRLRSIPSVNSLCNHAPPINDRQAWSVLLLARLHTRTSFGYPQRPTSCPQSLPLKNIIRTNVYGFTTNVTFKNWTLLHPGVTTGMWLFRVTRSITRSVKRLLPIPLCKLFDEVVIGSATLICDPVPLPDNGTQILYCPEFSVRGSGLPPQKISGSPIPQSLNEILDLLIGQPGVIPPPWRRSNNPSGPCCLYALNQFNRLERLHFASSSMRSIP